MFSGSSRTVEISVLIEMTTCELLCGDTFIFQIGNGGVWILKPHQVFLMFCLALQHCSTVQHQGKATPCVIYNWVRILLFKHFASDVALEWALCSQLWTMEEGSILGNAGQFSEQVFWNSVPGGMTVKGNRVPIIRGIFCFAWRCLKSPVPAAWDLGQARGRKTLEKMKPIAFWRPWFLLWLMPPYTGTLDFSHI